MNPRLRRLAAGSFTVSRAPRSNIIGHLVIGTGFGYLVVPEEDVDRAIKPVNGMPGHWTLVESYLDEVMFGRTKVLTPPQHVARMFPILASKAAKCPQLIADMEQQDGTPYSFVVLDKDNVFRFGE